MDDIGKPMFIPTEGGGLGKNKLLMLIAILGVVFIILAGLVLTQIIPVLLFPLGISSGNKNSEIIAGGGLFTKEEILDNGRLFTITDFKFGNLDGSPGDELGIAADGGVVYLDSNYKEKSSIIFSELGGHIDFIDLDSDGIVEYMDRGSWLHGAKVINHAGEEIWRYEGETGNNDMAAGDLDGDGDLEFVVGFNGGSGIHLLDKNGKLIWEKDGSNIWSVGMVDTNDDSQLEIVHSHADGDYHIKDENGDSISDIELPIYLGGFSKAEVPNNNGDVILFYDDNEIWMFHPNGSILRSFNASTNTERGDVWATPVKFKAGEPEYFAAIVPDIIITDTVITTETVIRSETTLFVYDYNFEIVYKEVIQEMCEAISPVPSGTGGDEAFLLGCKGYVWKYEMK